MLSGPHALLGSRLSRTSLTSEAVSSIESSFSPTPLKGGALSVGEAVLAGLNTELKNLFRMLALSRMSVTSLCPSLRKLGEGLSEVDT